MASIDVDIDDIVSGMTSWEKQELADELYEDGYTPKALEGATPNIGADTEFDEQVLKLIGNAWRLTKEDEETILRISNKIIQDEKYRSNIIGNRNIIPLRTYFGIPNNGTMELVNAQNIWTNTNRYISGIGSKLFKWYPIEIKR